jgi:hypothetical protein
VGKITDDFSIKRQQKEAKEVKDNKFRIFSSFALFAFCFNPTTV